MIVASHSEILAKVLASKTMDLMQSDFYARIFPETKIRPDAAPVMDFKTTAGGGRLAAGMTTSVTGRGADLLVLDDPLSAQNAYSAEIRQNVIRSYEVNVLDAAEQSRDGTDADDWTAASHL